MSTPTSLTYDLASPRRPSLDDLGGAAKQNDAVYPPDPVTMLTADDVNQWAKQIAALAAVAPLAVFTVGVVGTTYTLNQVMSQASGVVLGTITVARPSIGVVTLTWPANTFPTSGAKPVASFNTAGNVDRGCISSDTITNGVKVWMNVAGAAADASFTVEYR